MSNVVLIGKPNSGKSTLFNALTGSSQRVGNWPGVTVEKKIGKLIESKIDCDVVDLPGTYSLNLVDENTSLDEKIAISYLHNHSCNLIINVVDASNLERNLFLTLQLIETGIPIVLALNMLDVAKRDGKKINIDKLSKRLGCKVVPIVASKQEGLKELSNIVSELLSNEKVALENKENNILKYSEIIENEVSILIKELKTTEQIGNISVRRKALGLLEGDLCSNSHVPAHIPSTVKHAQNNIFKLLSTEADIVVASARYELIDNILFDCQKINASINLKPNVSKTIDKVVLNNYLGFPIFIFMMYLMFIFSINFGGVFQDFFDIASHTIFVDGLSYLLNSIQTPIWLKAILADGLGKGINTVVSFIPVLSAMFFFLSILEDSGYMVRAAFLMDRLMRVIGLPGKSFVPMIVGFGCNVPSVLGARTLEYKQDRILTIMLSPFMSCSARLAIFTVFVAAFFQQGAQNIVFALYVIGIVMAVLTGLILKKTLLPGKPSPMILELTEYHLPSIKNALRKTSHRLKSFILKAGRLILPLCVLIGGLNNVQLQDSDNVTVLESFGKTITPVFYPMGIDENNWQASVGLLTGVLAKEVVVGTLNTLYVDDSDKALENYEDDFSLKSGLLEALDSIVINFKNLKNVFSNPFKYSENDEDFGAGFLGKMHQKFDGKYGAFAYLLFILLYMPCVSVTAVMYREIGKGWTMFSVFWTTGLAYAVSVSFYQLANFALHPISSVSWAFGMFFLMYITLMFVKKYGKLQEKSFPTPIVILR